MMSDIKATTVQQIGTNFGCAGPDGPPDRRRIYRPTGAQIRAGLEQPLALSHVSHTGRTAGSRQSSDDGGYRRADGAVSALFPASEGVGAVLGPRC